MSSKTILVTGCAGFIGSHTCEKLSREGITVIGVDNFEDFYSPDIKRKNLEEIQDLQNFQFIELDLRDADSVNKLFQNNSFDAVVHLAGKGGVRPSIEHPQAYLDSNISATKNILEAMKSNLVNHFIFASSSSVYGNNKKTPFEETDDVSHPISPYAFTKKACELLDYTYHHLYGINVINLRFFTVIGPRQRPDLAVHKFVKKYFDGGAIEMYGDGDSARDYTYIGDTVEGIYQAINYSFENTKVYEIINLGNNYPIPLKDMIQTIEEVLEDSFEIEKMPMQPGDVDITFASIEKAKGLFKYEPKTSFREGVQSFVDWYKKRNNI